MKPRYLSEAETKRLKDALRNRDAEKRLKAESGNRWRAERGKTLRPKLPEFFVDHLEVMVLVSLLSGLRQNELFLLEWRDIEEDFSAINLRAETTKTKRSRSVPLGKTLKDVLVKWRKQTKGNSLVFSNNGEKIDNADKAWKKLLKDAEIADFRWHDMRHDFASQLVIRDVSIEKVSKLLGHTNIKTTQRYAHLSDSSLREAVETLG